MIKEIAHSIREGCQDIIILLLAHLQQGLVMISGFSLSKVLKHKVVSLRAVGLIVSIRPFFGTYGKLYLGKFHIVKDLCYNCVLHGQSHKDYSSTKEVKRGIRPKLLFL